MVKVAPVLTAFVAALLFGQSVAHPGHSVEHEIEERSAYLKHAKKDLSHCQAKLAARGVQARAIERRSATVSELRDVVKSGSRTDAVRLSTRLTPIQGRRRRGSSRSSSSSSSVRRRSRPTVASRPVPVGRAKARSSPSRRRLLAHRNFRRLPSAKAPQARRARLLQQASPLHLHLSSPMSPQASHPLRPLPRPRWVVPAVQLPVALSELPAELCRAEVPAELRQAEVPAEPCQAAAQEAAMARATRARLPAASRPLASKSSTPAICPAWMSLLRPRVWRISSSATAAVS